MHLANNAHIVTKLDARQLIRQTTVAPEDVVFGGHWVGLSAGSYQLSEVKKLRALKRSDALLKKSLRKVKASENSALLMRCAPVEDTVQRICCHVNGCWR